MFKLERKKETKKVQWKFLFLPEGSDDKNEEVIAIYNSSLKFYK